jgi:hypothetical protein
MFFAVGGPFGMAFFVSVVVRMRSYPVSMTADNTHGQMLR